MQADLLYVGIGRGNAAHRRLLTRFHLDTATNRLAAKPDFLAQWRRIVEEQPTAAELLAYRLAKLSNREPVTRRHPPSWQVVVKRTASVTGDLPHI